MLLRREWVRLWRWTDSIPVWIRYSVAPLFAPALLLILGPPLLICVCPKTSLIAVALLTVCYCSLFGFGVITWSDFVSRFDNLDSRGLLLIYAMFVGVAYLGVLEEIVGKRTTRRTDVRQAANRDDHVT